jgi:hypothetical protein
MPDFLANIKRSKTRQIGHFVAKWAQYNDHAAEIDPGAYENEEIPPLKNAFIDI